MTSAQTEQAPVLRVFGEHAARMGRLLRLSPLLLSRTTYAPRRAIHAVGAYLSLAEEAATGTDKSVAAILEQTHPRILLARAIPETPDRLYRALDRAGDLVQPQSFYEGLKRLCATPLIGAILDKQRIDGKRIRLAIRVLDADPILASMPSLLDRPDYEIDAINTMLQYLRAHRRFRDSDFRLPAASGTTALLKALQRELDGITAPEMPIVLPPGLRLITTVGELRRVGSELELCVRHRGAGGSDFWFFLASGEMIFIVGQDPVLFAGLRSAGPSLWTIDQIVGPSNVTISGEVRSTFETAVRMAGIRLAEQSPHRSFSVLTMAEADEDNSLDLADVESTAI